MKTHPPTHREIRRRAVVLGLGAMGAGLVLHPARSPAAPALETLRKRAGRLDQLHALVVAQRGGVVFAEALRGPPVDRPVNVKSVSKTVVASLVGAAIDRGLLPGVEATFAGVAPALVPRDADPRVREITLADLLTMQAGLERTSGPNYGRWVESRNWVAHALTRPWGGRAGGGRG